MWPINPGRYTAPGQLRDLRAANARLDASNTRLAGWCRGWQAHARQAEAAFTCAERERQKAVSRATALQARVAELENMLAVSDLPQQRGTIPIDTRTVTKRFASGHVVTLDKATTVPMATVTDTTSHRVTWPPADTPPAGGSEDATVRLQQAEVA